MPADPHLSTIEGEICDTDDYPGDREQVGGNIGINQLVQIVKQEFALVWLDTGAAFEPIFQQSQWTRPGKNFCKDSPEKRSDVKPAEERAGARQQSTENHPQNEQRMQEENSGRECRIEIRSNKGWGCVHILNLPRRGIHIFWKE